MLVLPNTTLDTSDCWIGDLWQFVLFFSLQGSSEPIHGTYSQTEGVIIRTTVRGPGAEEGPSCKHRMHEKWNSGVPLLPCLSGTRPYIWHHKALRPIIPHNPPSRYHRWPPGSPSKSLGWHQPHTRGISGKHRWLHAGININITQHRDSFYKWESFGFFFFWVNHQFSP